MLRLQTSCFSPATDLGVASLVRALEARLGGRLEEAEAVLAASVEEAGDQPLLWYYLFAVRFALGEESAAKDSLERLRARDGGDPVAQLLDRHLRRKGPPRVTEGARLENLRRLGSTALLRNSYGIAVGAIFESIRNRTEARVLDVGVGTGSQMIALFDLLKTREHRLERLTVYGLDFVDEYLEAAEERIVSAAGDVGRVQVEFRALKGRVQDVEPAWLDPLPRGGKVDVINASLTLHEVPGAGKVAALERLRELRPHRLVLAEWNQCTESVLPPDGLRFLFNVRSFVAESIAAVREELTLGDARETMRVILAQGEGQVTCPSEERQECYLEVESWKALLRANGFAVADPARSLLAYAPVEERAGPGREPWYVAPYRDGDAEPMALLIGGTPGA